MVYRGVVGEPSSAVVESRGEVAAFRLCTVTVVDHGRTVGSFVVAADGSDVAARALDAGYRVLGREGADLVLEPVRAGAGAGPFDSAMRALGCLFWGVGGLVFFWVVWAFVRAFVFK